MSKAKKSDRALVVVDMHADLVARSKNAQEIVRYIKGELKYFRERDRPIFFAKRQNLSELLPVLTPRRGEQIYTRTHDSAFKNTELLQMLNAHQIKRLTLVGLETHNAILATALDAKSNALQVVVPDPCVTSVDLNAHKEAWFHLRDVCAKSIDERASAQLAGV